MNNEEYNYFTTLEGLRCVHRHRPGASVEYCGVAVNAGSRDECKAEEGLAHFVEHTIFKGTERRRSVHIINRMESCGGELNAFTTKESTVVYSIFPAGNFDRATDLIADLVMNSRFPAEEIDREREVVLDEVASYLDMPSEAVYDDFEDLLFAGSALGHNILGTRETVRSFTPEVCRGFLSRFYTAPNMAFFYLGPADVEKVRRIVSRRFAFLSVSAPALNRVALAEVPVFEQVRTLEGGHQAHTVAGCRLPGLHSELNPAIQMLVNHIGGPGMNSLLNVQLREKRGLVYSVEASSARFTDCGMLTIYMGCDREDLSRCRRIVETTMRRVAENGVTPARLSAMKRQYLGQLAVAGDNCENLAIGMGRRILHFPTVLTDARVRELVEEITPDDIAQAAALMSPERLSWLTLC